MLYVALSDKAATNNGDLANSEISERWNQAHEERGHYRLVLGMPNQNDLLGELKSMQELDQTSLTRACLDFSPISRCKNTPPRPRQRPCAAQPGFPAAR